ncbi:Transcription factor spt8 [Thoreauomyces humboldtii]|nr:Transcription factor spt8 [Thoreauomyces humboldtii]
MDADADADAAGSDEDAEGSDEAGDSEDAEGFEEGGSDDGNDGQRAEKSIPYLKTEPEFPETLPDSASSSLMDMDIPSEDPPTDDGVEYCTDEISIQPHVEDCIGYEIAPFVRILCSSNECELYDYDPQYGLPGRWLFTGGEDGLIRKFDFPATLHGDQGLTQLQRHGLVDSVEKGGVLASVWENEEFPMSYHPHDRTPLDPDSQPVLSSHWSPVYSLDVHPDGIWGVSGCKVGQRKSKPDD